MTIKIPTVTQSQSVRGPSGGGLLNPNLGSKGFGMGEAQAGFQGAKLQEQNIKQFADLANKAATFALAIKKRNDVTLAKSAYNSANDEMRGAMAQMRTVTDAKGVSELPRTADKKIQSIYQKHTQGLTPEQAQLVKPMWDQKRSSALDAIYDYSRNQMNVIETRQDKLQIAGAIEESALNYKSPVQLTAARDEIDATLSSIAKRGKISKEEKEFNKKQAYTQLHTAVIMNALAERNVGFASNYLGDVKGELSAKSRAMLQDKVSVIEATEVANAAADIMVDSFDTEEEMIGYIDKHFAKDPYRNKMKQEVRNRMIDQRRFEADANNEKYDASLEKVNKTDSYSDAMRTVFEFDGDEKHRAVLEARAQTRFAKQLKKLTAAEAKFKKLRESNHSMSVEDKINAGEYSTPRQVAESAILGGADDKEKERLVAMWESDGKMENITLSRVASTIKAMGEKAGTGDVASLYDIVKRNFENTDKAITQSQLEEMIAQHYASGESIGEGNRWWEFGDPNETLLKSTQKGRRDDWYPDLNAFQAQQARAGIAQHNAYVASKGKGPNSPEWIDESDPIKVRGYYRSQIMNQPNSIENQKTYERAVIWAKLQRESDNAE